MVGVFIFIVSGPREDVISTDQLGAGVSSTTSKIRPTGAVVGATGRIAYVVKEGNENYIYLMDASGKSTKKLTSCLEGECYPSWSPDGKKIVFQRQEDGAAIYVMNSDGTNIKRLSGAAARDVRPSWSPDGKKIIYTHVVKPSDTSVPDTEINVMNADGTNVKTILPSNGTFNIEPRWSPNGKKIVFMRGVVGVGQHIYTMNADGSDIKQITTIGANGDPAWSPDGSRISFGSNREGGGKLNIFTMNADGSDVKQVTHFLPPYEAGDTSWSPDGKKIVFEWDVDGKGQSDPNVKAEVWIVNADGTGAASTGQACSSVGCSPRWQPK